MKIIKENFDNIKDTENPYLQDAKNEIENSEKAYEDALEEVADKDTIEAELGTSDKENLPDEVEFPKDLFKLDESLFDDEASKLKDQGYEELTNMQGKYILFRKLENGKGKWKALDSEDKNAEAFDITYDQALGYEDINPTPIQKLARDLGKKLLPPSGYKAESLNEDFNDRSLKDFVYDTIVGAIDNLAMIAANEVPGYDADWCIDEQPADLENDIMRLVNSLVKELLAYKE